MVAKQPIDLFDGMFGTKTASLRKASANVGDASSGGSEGAKHRIPDRAKRLFVKFSVETVMENISFILRGKPRREEKVIPFCDESVPP